MMALKMGVLPSALLAEDDAVIETILDIYEEEAGD